MRKDCPLAEKSAIEVSGILPYPVSGSEQSAKVDLPRWCRGHMNQLNVMAIFNLAGNAAEFARESLGVALTFDKLIEVSEESDLCFRQIIPALHTRMYLIWKKYQVFTPAAEHLLSELKSVLK